MATLLYDISIYTQWAGSLVVAIGCLSKFSSRALHIKILGSYAILSFIFSLIQRVAFAYFPELSINGLANTFTLAEAILFCWINYTINNKTLRKGILFFLAVYILYYVSVFLFFSQNSFSLIRLGRDFLMILTSLSYFYYLLQELPERDLLRTSMFWINSAVIFYFSGTFILSLAADYINQVLKVDFSGFWAFRNFFRFAFCVVLTYAAWLEWKSISGRRLRPSTDDSSSLL